MLKKLQRMLSMRDEYDEGSQRVFSDWSTRSALIEKLNVMKKTDGWRELEGEIRIKLRTAIYDSIKNDKQISTLLDILHISDTTSRQTQLESEIDLFLPKDE